jgi:hypothetical protein
VEQYSTYILQNSAEWIFNNVLRNNTKNLMLNIILWNNIKHPFCRILQNGCLIMFCRIILKSAERMLNIDTQNNIEHGMCKYYSVEKYSTPILQNSAEWIFNNVLRNNTKNLMFNTIPWNNIQHTFCRILHNECLIMV